jgi:predicted PurR-regulated permease PerM
MGIDQSTRLYRFTFVLAMTILVLVAFLALIRIFVVDILLAAIFAGLSYPLFKKCARAFGGREPAAAAVVVVVGLIAFAAPLLFVAAMVGHEAVRLSAGTLPWLKSVAAHPQTLILGQLANIKGAKELVSSLTGNAANIVNKLATFLSRELSFLFSDAALSVFNTLVIAFAAGEFLRRGPALIDRVMERVPVSRAEARTITDRTLKITAATLKSGIIGGLLQGTLVGIGFAVAGIGEPWFWGTVAAFASIIDASLVWAPGGAYLLMTNHMLAGSLLLVYGALVVSLSVNALLFRITGRGAGISTFLVFVSTFGGAGLLGPAGILIGPVVVGVTIGVLDLYYAVLRESGLLRSSDDAALRSDPAGNRLSRPPEPTLSKAATG